jgi:hypothetical protein
MTQNICTEQWMRKLTIDLENCYGIKRMNHTFDFSRKSAFAIYAPNGAMKSSLAQTFKDISEEAASRDRIFPDRVCCRKVTDENGAELLNDQVFVVVPYDADFNPEAKTATLLVDAKLRKEFENAQAEVEKAKTALLQGLREQSKSRKNLEQEIASTFTNGEDFYTAVNRVRDEVEKQSDAPFSDIEYDRIFDDKVAELLSAKDIQAAIADYVRKYNELLDASTYFKRGTFNYFNAATIAKSLADNGFFDAKHTVSLNASKSLQITTHQQLEVLIEQEKAGIAKDKELRKRFDAIGKKLEKNASCRAFQDYLTQHESLLPELENVKRFKERLWKSYFKARFSLYQEYIEKYRAAEAKTKAIEAKARAQGTQWEKVIEIFNSRFFVPFKLTAENKIAVMLEKDAVLKLGFVFMDGDDETPVQKSTLMETLSTGERKALYILNLLFEIEVRRSSGQETLFVVDDIADSFDYKNKYAIIQYLMEIAEEPNFKEILLTHNFDFFRTVQSRFVSYACCLMASKSSNGVDLVPATGIKNIFANDWKGHFFDDLKKRIAAIPFIRNLVEYTKGDTDPDYIKLTSLLHWKADSASITQADLDKIYTKLFGIRGTWPNQAESVINEIHEAATSCLTANSGINFENKIVLSIGVRLAAEKFMVDKLGTSAVGEIAANQTQALLKQFKQHFSTDAAAIETIQRVVLMTPENIHLNSFMYEPILDMSDDHLRKLYQDAFALK